MVGDYRRMIWRILRRRCLSRRVCRVFRRLGRVGERFLLRGSRDFGEVKGVGRVFWKGGWS